MKKPKEQIKGNNIKKILDEIGMSQEELSDLAFNGNASHLSRIINNKTMCISLPIAMRICKFLNKPIEEVFIY